MSPLTDQGLRRLLLLAKLQGPTKRVPEDLSPALQVNYLTGYYRTTGYKDGRYSSATPLSVDQPTTRTPRQRLFQHVVLGSSKSLTFEGSKRSSRWATLLAKHSRVNLASLSFVSDQDAELRLTLTFVLFRPSILRRAFARVTCFLSSSRTSAKSTED
jgi:hypothetical protein